MNTFTNKKQSALISDRVNTTPTHGSNVSFQQYKDSIKIKKPSYMLSSKHPHLNHTKLNQSLFLSTHNTLRERQTSIKKQGTNGTPLKNYTSLNNSLAGSLIAEQRHPGVQKTDSHKKHILMSQTKSSIFPSGNYPQVSQFNTDRGYQRYSQYAPVKQNSSIIQTKHHNPVIPQKQQNYFQYILQYSYRSKKGCSISDPKKVNQDSHIAATNLNNQSWLHYFGVCDGHGQNGHIISSYLKRNLPLVISRIKDKSKDMIQQLVKAHKIISDRIQKELTVDLQMSGSTSVGVYLNENKLYCCNLGDSKAVLGSFEVNNKWKATALSIDHTLQYPQQATRIIRSNGRIDSYRDSNGNQVGPLRVWLKNQDAPGLAMTRCFGDYLAARVGVISVPQIKQFTLTKNDKIIIVASDGIWQFLTQQQVIDLISPYYISHDIQGACNTLLQTATKLWKQDNSEAIDDITFVLLFLDYPDKPKK